MFLKARNAKIDAALAILTPQVPLDKPLAAHDMLRACRSPSSSPFPVQPPDPPRAPHPLTATVRFMQVDTLHSAGSAARIPSRVGAQPATVLGATHPNGSTLVDSSGDVLLSSPDAALLLPGGGEGDTPPEQQGRQKELSDEGYDIAHERFYGPRRTAALVVLLVLLAGAVWGVLRWRGGRRRRERYRRVKGKGRATAGAGRGIRLEERGGAEEEEEGEEGEDGGEGAYGRERGRAGRQDRGREGEAETVPVFDVGEDDDESDDAVEGNEARQRRRDDPEAWGDLGRTPEPQPGFEAWSDSRRGRG